ncbi:MAG: dialkylresorcinol condensing enzyme [Epsilonproteobacteria bacterium]|nr:dialkylresorcinol condensing enzyme [Campylobacterota bacterium]
MKKILVVSYSQSGQLNDVLKRMMKPLEEVACYELVHRTIKPTRIYPFPWDFWTFMGVFPEAVALEPCEIEPFEADENVYDTVILAYQVWFLSPSIPITAFLKSAYAKEKLANVPVVTVIGCRNMWIMAQEKVKMLLNAIGAKLIDNIVLVDQGSSLATFITTPRWMLTGKKEAFWGLPKAGISEAEIARASRFGEAIHQGLQNDEEKRFTPLCEGLGAVNVDEKLIRSEKIGTRSFTIWGKFIRAFSKQGEMKRHAFIALYTLFLVAMIITVVPLNMLIQTLYRKLNKTAVEKEKAFYELPSGSQTDKLKEFLAS